VKSRIFVSDNAWYPMGMQSSALDAPLRALICLCDVQSRHKKQTAGRHSTAENMDEFKGNAKDVSIVKNTDDCSWNG
jgi:hypothetical protein